MILLLQSHDRYNDLVELDTSTGHLVRHYRRDDPDLGRSLIQGHYCEMDGQMIFLYRQDDQLHLRINDSDMELGDDIQISFLKGVEKNTLILQRGRDHLLEWTYSSPTISPDLDIDPTPFVEEEDHDFGLFVYNVLTNYSRKARIYRSK
jgi:hypothetical protein